MDEAFVILGVGTVTTPRAMTRIAFHLARDKEVARKLCDELRPVMYTLEDHPALSQLEHLPHLVSITLYSKSLSSMLTQSFRME